MAASEVEGEDAIPKLAASLLPASDEPLIEMWNVRKYFPIRGGIVGSHIGDVRAVDGVSFPIHKGETVGLVGESGCGKTTVGRLVLRLIEPTSGHALYHPPKEMARRTEELYVQLNSLKLASGKKGESRAFDNTPQVQPILRELDQIAQRYSIYRMKQRQLRKMRGKLQIVFQDPFSSLSPRMLVRDIVAEPMTIHGMGSKNTRYKRAAEILQEVGLNPEHLWRFPHEFSGGQRQRIGIARALALEPEFIVLDEPTSALDVSVQAQVLNILLKLQREHNLAYLFISHHLSVVRAVSHRVVVMYLGEVVETCATEELFAHPLHPYTQALLSAIPIPDPALKRERIILKGDVPSPASPPSGCHFHTRCPMVMDICSKVSPPLLPIKGRGKHLVACHLYTAMGDDFRQSRGETSGPSQRSKAGLPAAGGALPSEVLAPTPATVEPHSGSQVQSVPESAPIPTQPAAPLPSRTSQPSMEASKPGGPISWRSHPMLEHSLSTDSTFSLHRPVDTGQV